MHIYIYICTHACTHLLPLRLCLPVRQQRLQIQQLCPRLLQRFLLRLQLARVTSALQPRLFQQRVVLLRRTQE